MLRKIPFLRKYNESTGKGIHKMGTYKEMLPISFEDRLFFEALYDEYKNFMFYTARKYVDSQFECEDIVQDTVERLLRNIVTIRQIPTSGLRKYIVLTIKAVYLDGKKKKHGDIPIHFDDKTIEILIEKGMLTTSDWYDFMAVLDVERLKNELPRRDWIILEGKYVIGYSQDELAQLIGVSTDSVRMIVCRAKRRAREILISQ